MNHDCSIVIATHNRCATLRNTLEHLYALAEKPRLIVVDNASTDETDKVWRPFANRVLYLKLRRNLGAFARTIGARQARTPFIGFCDDDTYWLPGGLRRAVERFQRYPRVALINARVLVGEGNRPDPACQAMSAGEQPESHLPGVPIVYFMGGACIVRTAAFLQVGGYHQRYFIGAEESLLALDLAAQGWRLWYCDDLIVRHHPSAANRDPAIRRRLVLRNRLWTVLLRRSVRSAVRALAEYAHAARTDPVVRSALTEAIAGIPWIVRERRTIPSDLERRVAQFDRAVFP